jgi:two-component system cell cycle sensor histidine kinase/response regulator CckA
MKSDVVLDLENAGWPSLLVDSSGTVLRGNERASQLFKTSEQPMPAHLKEIWASENETTLEHFLAGLATPASASSSIKLKTFEGKPGSFSVAICPVEHEGKKNYLLQLLPELAPSAMRSTDAGISLKQKLDCALQLTRSVSLDFNNALTGILGHTTHILSKMEPAHPWRNSLLEVQKAASRAAEIANDLGTFSHQEKEVRTQATGNLNAVLQRCWQSFQENPPAEQPVQWTMQLERSLFTANFDEGKMQQAFMRILENAIQALRAPGRITIQTRNLELSEATQDRNVRLSAGAYVCAELTDNGCGIEPEVLPKIFEPFFTTKKGTTHRGLGLAWVYGIVTNHGGGVAVSSQPNVGTSVRVYLPAERRIVANDVASTKDLKGTETILIVDDEEVLLSMTHTILTSYGYKVLTAISGQKGLEQIKQHAEAIDLVITDMAMPSMGGREFVEKAHAIEPGLRIICTSGYVRPSVAAENERFYLQKPFTTQELLVKIKDVLMLETSSASQ